MRYRTSPPPCTLCLLFLYHNTLTITNALHCTPTVSFPSALVVFLCSFNNDFVVIHSLCFRYLPLHTRSACSLSRRLCPTRKRPSCTVPELSWSMIIRVPVRPIPWHLFPLSVLVNELLSLIVNNAVIQVFGQIRVPCFDCNHKSYKVIHGYKHEVAVEIVIKYRIHLPRHI